MRPAIGQDVYRALAAVLIGDVTVGDRRSVWCGAVLRATHLACTTLGRVSA